MRVTVGIQLDGAPPLAPKQQGQVLKQLVYERDVKDFERFEEGVRAYMLNELPLLFREALEEFRGILPIPEAPQQEAQPAPEAEPAPQPEPDALPTDAPAAADAAPPA